LIIFFFTLFYVHESSCEMRIDRCLPLESWLIEPQLWLNGFDDAWLFMAIKITSDLILRVVAFYNYLPALLNVSLGLRNDESCDSLSKGFDNGCSNMLQLSNFAIVYINQTASYTKCRLCLLLKRVRSNYLETFSVLHCCRFCTMNSYFPSFAQ
jgi:hypothetical protein